MNRTHSTRGSKHHAIKGQNRHKAQLRKGAARRLAERNATDSHKEKGALAQLSDEMRQKLKKFARWQWLTNLRKSKWDKPHQGEKECARRRRQMAMGKCIDPAAINNYWDHKQAKAEKKGMFGYSP